MANIVYIATSLDGYIARKDGNIDWLMEIPNPDKSDFGFSDFMQRIDGIILGSGIPLFEEMDSEIKLEHNKTEILHNALVKSRYIKKKD